MLESDRATAEIIAKDDPRLTAESITYPGAAGDIRAFFARPKGTEKLPGVLVIHQNRGLNAHIEDVARRIALERYLTVAPNASSPVGGTPSDESKAIELMGQLDIKSSVSNYIAAVKYLKSRPDTTGKIGVVGFCWGGGIANELAVSSPDLIAVVPFYPTRQPGEEAYNIKASLLLHYAGLDEGVNKGMPAYEAALKKASIDYKIYVYEGAQHAFNDDTNPARYNKEAAQLAWSRTVLFLKEKLKT